MFPSGITGWWGRAQTAPPLGLEWAVGTPFRSFDPMRPVCHVRFRKEYPAAQPGVTGGALADRVTARVNASPRIKRTLRELSSRYSSVRWLRVLAWRVLERSRARSGS